MGSLAAASLASTARSAEPALIFGVLADPQYADTDARGTRHYRASLAKLRAAAAEFNRLPVAFVLNLGDTVDHDDASFDAVLDAFRAIEAPVHHLLGNHDFGVADARKGGVPARLGRRERYAAFSRGGLRFLLLDGTELGPAPYPAGSAEHRAAEERVAALKAAGCRQAVPWGGGIGDAQRTWMERQCEAARQAGERILCACHYPVGPDTPHSLYNRAEILASAAKRREIVAWFAGHDHAGGFGIFDGLPCVTFHGMVETADTNAFAIVTVHADRLEIEGFGREPSRRIPFRA